MWKDPKVAKEKLRKYLRRRDVRKRRSAHSVKWNKEHPEWRRPYLIRRREKQRAHLGTTPMPSCCECCGADKSLKWDHDHVTGLFRGWLCFPCNMGLGLLGDTLEKVEQAAEYLKKSVR